MNSIFKVFFSLGLTFGISTLIALFFSKDLFWLIWSTVTVLQFVIFYFWNSFTTNRVIKDLEVIKLEQIKESTRNLVQVTCPCDENFKQALDFRFDQKNVFNCEKCGKNVACDINVTTVLVTEPIYFDEKKR